MTLEYHERTFEPVFTLLGRGGRQSRPFPWADNIKDFNSILKSTIQSDIQISKYILQRIRGGDRLTYLL